LVLQGGPQGGLQPPGQQPPQQQQPPPFMGMHPPPPGVVPPGAPPPGAPPVSSLVLLIGLPLGNLALLVVLWAMKYMCGLDMVTMMRWSY